MFRFVAALRLAFGVTGVDVVERIMRGGGMVQAESGPAAAVKKVLQLSFTGGTVCTGTRVIHARQRCRLRFERQET